MSAQTGISWCDSTFNYVEGCTKISPGCKNCYAETRNKRFSKGENWGPGAPRKLRSDKYWADALRDYQKPFYACTCGWRGDAPSVAGGSITEWMMSCPACDSMDISNARRRNFTSSVADVFDNESPEDQRQRLWALIEATPQCDWLVLTKRIGNAQKILPATWLTPGCWPAHVMLGSTMVNQDELDRDWLKLAHFRRWGARLFWSLEPLLGPIDAGVPLGVYEYEHGRGWHQRNLGANDAPDWVIVGGESGHGARPMHPDWVRSLRDQCAAAGVAFHFKQWGEWREDDGSDGLNGLTRALRAKQRGMHVFDDGTEVYLYGKKAADRLLDGIEHNGFPA